MPEKINIYHDAEGKLSSVQVDDKIYYRVSSTPTQLWGIVDKLSKAIIGDVSIHVDFHSMYEYGDKLTYTDAMGKQQKCVYLGKSKAFADTVLIHIEGFDKMSHALISQLSHK